MLSIFPDFKVAFLEGGTEFIVGLKHRMQETLEDLPCLRNKLTQPLEKYFNRLYFLVDRSMLKDSGRCFKYVVKELGADHLLFGSDYPHDEHPKAKAAKPEDFIDMHFIRELDESGFIDSLYKSQRK